MVKNKILKVSKKSQFGQNPGLAVPQIHVVKELCLFIFFLIILLKYIIHTMLYTTT